MTDRAPVLTAPGWAPVVASYACALAVAAGIGYLLLGIPIQLTDCFGNMLKLDQTWPELLRSEFEQRAYLRPFLFAELKLVYDLSGGNYFAWFRGTHVVQVLALVLLFIQIVRPRTWADAAVVTFGLAALVGIHTFGGLVTEAFPVNTFLTIVLCCFAALELSLSERRWWSDAAAIALFVIAALTVESGLLVGVITIGAAIIGCRGVSRPAVGVVAALFVGYFALRFLALEVGSPGLIERSSGYGFAVLEPEELVERFGGNPLGFYVYNVLTSAASVLLSEPRAGVFRVTYGFAVGNPESSQIVNVVASLLATGLIVAFLWARRAAWLSLRLDRDDRIVALFLLVLAANATISYPYTKDVIMSPAGALYALAAAVAAREVLPRWWNSGRGASVAVLVCCLALGVTWSIRYVGVHMALRQAAAKIRTEWAYVDDWLARENIKLEEPADRALFETLRHQAIYGRPLPSPLPLVNAEIFDVD